MNARLLKIWQDLQRSYYFIPALMALGAIILAFVTSHIDKNLDFAAIQKLGWFYSNSADGARVILSTIAGSMITVAGVTFSLTMVAVTSASAQFGPRLIGNFMRDRANQFTLGTFTATFVYCLLIMRVARIGDEGSGEDLVSEIIPNISLLFALGLTLASVGVLIYFIHHIPETLNVGNITAKVGRELRDRITEAFPSDVGDGTDADNIDMDAYSMAKAIGVPSKAEGYVQTFDDQALLDIAKTHDLVVRLQYRPGDFIVSGKNLVHYWPQSGANNEDELADEIRSCFALGREKTGHQNLLFLTEQLVEILGRALSPGINDPFTAINCMNWFHSALNAICQGNPPSPFRRDDKKQLRLIAYPVSLERFASVICDQSRPYIASDRNASLHMMTILAELAADARTKDQKDLFTTHLEKLKDAALAQQVSKADQKDIAERFERAKKIIKNPDYYAEQRNLQTWIGGRA